MAQSATATAIDVEEILRIVDKHSTLEGPLLPMLHSIQDRYGCIPSEAHAPICDTLNITRAELYGVISFYHDFRDTPASKLAVQICCAEACQAVGSRELESHAPQTLGVDFGETHASGAYRLERVYCLGNCACGPSVRVGDVVHGRVNLAELSSLVAQGADA